MSECEVCGPTAVSNGTTCEACGAGTVPSMVHRAQCTSCLGGSVRPATAQVCAVCPANHYASSDHTKCIECPRVGVECSKGVLVVLPGYWLPPTSPSSTSSSSSSGLASTPSDAASTTPHFTADTVLYKCPPGACEVGANGTAGCAAARRGPLCGICVDGYFEQGTRCAECQGGSSNWVLLVLVSMLVLAAVSVSVVRATSMHLRPSTNPDHDIAPVVKIALNYLQVRRRVGGGAGGGGTQFIGTHADLRHSLTPTHTHHPGHVILQ